MTNATEKQIDYMLKLANQLTGERARYLSQSSVLPKSVKSGAEASGLIDDLQAAIEAEEKRQADTGITEGAKISFRFTRKTGEDGGRLAGTVSGFQWSGTEVVGVFLDDVDTSQATYEPSSRTWFALARMADVSTGDDPEALQAERARLLARVAEIDAILAGSARA